jgi:hypothetical protein
MCIINRLSIYLLLLIMINLSLLTYSLVSVIFRGNKSTSKKLLNLLSTLVPLFLIILGYALDGTTESVVLVEEVICLVGSIYDLLLSYTKVNSVRGGTVS